MKKYLAKSKLKSVYVENNKAIKVFDKNYNKSDVLYEALNTARVEDAGVNIPKLLEVAVTDGKWSITSEYVEGPTLTQLIEKYPDKADDYIKKPFSIMELITRVKALLRRTETEDIKILQVENITLDHERHMVFVDDKPVELTFKEYELLRLLMTNPSVVLSREVIMRHVWGTEFEGESRTVDMHIKTLRQKLGEAGSKIRTVRNVGYVIE